MASNPHVLAIIFPLQGHINPMIQLCNRLVSKGIRITFVMTNSHSKLFNRQPQQETDSNLISIETVPDSPSDEAEGLDSVEAFFRSFRAALTSGLSEIIARYSNSGEALTAVVYDSFLPWMLEFAHEKGLKGAALFTHSAAVCSIFNHVHKGSLEISHDDASSPISLPGLPVMAVNDLPSFFHHAGGYEALLRTLVEQFSTFEKADWRLLNTFDTLENKVVNWMRKKCKIHTIGPTVPSMYTDKRLLGNYDYGFSFFKPNTESLMNWMDKKEDRSVIYVSFGSIADLSEKQMEEVALGLSESQCHFLWIVRESEQRKLPLYLISGLAKRGLIVNWCTQLQVLSHRAVGAFFSHCGWNSTLEALTLGVPMVVMPQWTDQPTNAKLVVDVWKIGVRVKVDGNGIVLRDEVAACLNQVLQGERGDEIRRNVLKWKGLAIEAVSEGGSSDQNVAEFADQLVSTHIHNQKSHHDVL